MIDLGELAELAREAGSVPWCLHPNGTSVWTGDEYTGELVPDQRLVCQDAPLDESTVARLSFIAAANPAVVLELIDRARGLSEVRLVQGPEDNDEVCVVCGWATSGHTHTECYANGVHNGALDENIACAAKLAEALHVDMVGYFNETLEVALSKKTIDELIDASSLGTPEAKAVRAQAPKATVDRALKRADEIYELVTLRRKASHFAATLIALEERGAPVPDTALAMAKATLGKA